MNLRTRVERAGLVAAMAVTTVNLWTGAPLLGLWLGSRVAPSSGISMLAVAVVVLGIGAAGFVLIRILGALSARHDRLTGREHTVRRHTPWLRSMSGERPRELGGEAPALSALDYVLVAVVALGFLAFEIWFLFFSTSPLDGRTGRS